MPRDSETTQITRVKIDASGARPARPGEACVIVIYGPELGKRIKLGTAPFRIGRSASSDLPLDQESVSRNHARITYDGSDYWLADGFHRLLAAVQAGLKSIPSELRSGTRRDAVLHAAGAHADHGLRRSCQDKRRAVRLLLEDAEWGRWSDREIARKCGVHHELVGTVRREVAAGISGGSARCAGQC